VIVSTPYSPVASALVPAIIARADQNDAGMLALASLGDSGGDNWRVGMQLSVICAKTRRGRDMKEPLARCSAST
jgi:hypothetical protein